MLRDKLLYGKLESFQVLWEWEIPRWEDQEFIDQ